MGTPDSNQHPKSTFRLGFFIGLLVGLAVAIAFYFVDKGMDDPVKILSPKISQTTQATETPAETDRAESDEKTTTKSHAVKHRKPQPAPVDSAAMAEIDSLSEEEDVEFALEDDAKEVEPLLLEKGISSRDIEVRSLDKSVPPVTRFEVEEWTEYVKNRYSYQRSNDKLKIRGFGLDDLNVFYFDGNYYIEKNGRYFAIPENDAFQRLQEIQLPKDENQEEK